MPIYSNSFEIEAISDGVSDRSITVRALQEVTLYELVEGIYDFMSQDKDFRYDLHIHEVEFISSTGNNYKFKQNTYWMNPGTILSDLSRQLNI